MQEATTLALRMASGRNRQDLTSDSMLAMALTRCLEVLGEAVSKLRDEVRLRFSGIPFSKMISMRNRLIHAYFDVDFKHLRFPRPPERSHRSPNATLGTASHAHRVDFDTSPPSSQPIQGSGKFGHCGHRFPRVSSSS